MYFLFQPLIVKYSHMTESARFNEMASPNHTTESTPVDTFADASSSLKTKKHGKYY